MRTVMDVWARRIRVTGLYWNGKAQMLWPRTPRWTKGVRSEAAISG